MRNTVNAYEDFLSSNFTATNTGISRKYFLLKILEFVFLQELNHIHLMGK